MTRWRLDLAYDGTDYRGWAAQPGQRTVQGVLEEWLARLLRPAEPVALVVAGRTDAGVHAVGQVAHVDLPDALDDDVEARLLQRLRRVVPDDIVVRGLARAPGGFDARFSALARRYCYRLWDADSSPDPRLRRQVTTVAVRLDVAAMGAAGASLLGLRDFAPFCKRRDGATSIRVLQELSVRRCDDPCGTIEVWAQADAFCHSMVRCLAGVLVCIGSGRRDRVWLADAAARTERHGDIPALPPGGLTLEQVFYPADDELAAQAARARVQRTLDDLPVGPVGPSSAMGGPE